MKKAILFLAFSFLFVTAYSQRSYWKKKFNNGTLYVALVKSNAKFGPHIRVYHTGNRKAHLIQVRYYSSSRRYKLKRKQGWSNRSYLYYGSGGHLIWVSPSNGRIILSRINRSDIPKYIRERTYYPKGVSKY